MSWYSLLVSKMTLLFEAYGVAMVFQKAWKPAVSVMMLL